MSSKSLFFAQVLSALLTMGSAYGTMTLCKATVVDNQVQGTFAECLTPAWFNAFNPVGSGYVDSRISKPAKLDGVDVTWFLDTDGCPAINVTIRATSQHSAQDYRINMLSNAAVTPVFCGRILTKPPPEGDCPQKQTFAVEIRCPNGILKHSSDIFVPVKVKGNDPVNTKYKLPSCEDPTMARSNACTEQEKKRIQFKLKQDGNSAIAILNTKSAYSDPRPTSNVYAMLREKTGDDTVSWRTAQPPVELFWPERTTTFSNLTMGQTYQVLVWRPREITRYTELITMRKDRKVEDSHFMKTLSRRAAKARWYRKNKNE